MRHFASDNYSGIHPELLKSLISANEAHETAYGADSYTERLNQQIKTMFGAEAVAFPVFNGTGANVVALTAATPRWGSVVVAETAHVHTDESGAPERMAGLKLLPLSGQLGKLTPELIAGLEIDQSNVHAPLPSTVSISQSTELGTVYTVEELKALSKAVKDQGLMFHIDGARIFNAAAALGATLPEITSEIGADIFSLGGTKIGALAAELVVVLNPEIKGTDFVQKYLAQLPSKARYISAQFLTLLEHDLGLEIGRHTNALAAQLAEGLREISKEHSQIKLSYPADANAVFVRLPTELAAKLRETYHFYDWNLSRQEVRLMTSWDSTEADISDFLELLKASL